MKRKNKAIASVSLALMLSVVNIGSQAIIFADKKGEAESRRRQLESEQQSIKDAQNALENDKNTTKAYIKTIDAELTKVNEKIYDLTLKSKDKKEEIGKSEKKLKKSEESIAEQYSTMKLRIQYMYENGDTEFLSMLLSADTIADFLNKAEYVSKITDYDQEMLEKMQKTKEDIETTKAKLEKENAQLIALKEEQEEEQKYLNTVLVKKEKELENTVVAMNGNVKKMYDKATAIQNEKDIISEIEQIEAEQKRIAAEAESRRQASKNSGYNVPDVASSPSAGSSSFIWPLPSNYRSRSSTFGGRTSPITGAYESHCGDDYPAPAGTPIYAVAGGTVTASGYSGGMGNYVIIDHGGGLSSVYMHASVLLCSAGQSVSQGTTIALVGTTGPSTGNHLHISFRLNGTWVDPKSYIGG